MGPGRPSRLGRPEVARPRGRPREGSGVTTESPNLPEELGPRIGYWGRSNLASFGELARPLLFKCEIQRRLPRARIHAYAPLGPRHAAALGDGPAPAEPGAW